MSLEPIRNPTLSRRSLERRVVLLFALVVVALLALSYGGGLAAAADAPTAGPNSGAPKAGPSRGATKPGGKSASPARSDELTEGKAASDLDDQLLEGTAPARRPMTKPPGPPAGPPPGKPADGKPAEPGAPDPAHEGESTDAEPSAGDNPLAHVVAQMRAAQRRLESLRKSDADTKQLQDQIVAELADLIAQLEKQQSGQQSASNNARRQSPSSANERKSVRQPGTSSGSGRADDRRPAKESSERAGQGEKVPPTADQLRGLMKDVWGQLPAREREQMLQSPPEQFLPKYELLLEKYYKRLAEEQKRRP